MIPWNELMAGVEAEYHHACEKHPKFADLLMEEIIPPEAAELFVKWSLSMRRRDNDERIAQGKVTAGKVLHEEILEIYEAVIVEHNQEHAIEECNQAIAVCLRLKEELMKSRPFGRGYYQEQLKAAPINAEDYKE